MTAPRALIAEDEAALARDLARRLALLWPELEIVAICADGDEAAAQLAALRPDIAFLDIRMPGRSGLQVARELPAGCRPVFVTAYDEHAVEAFERAALDYLLKPVSDARLAQSVTRLRAHGAPAADAALLDTLLQRLGGAPATRREEAAADAALGGSVGDGRLRWIRAAVGERVKLIAVSEVLCFVAEDKYTSVVTAGGDYPIRTSIRELETSLDPHCFWRVHRASITNVAAITEVNREFRGRLELRLRDTARTLIVSRAYAWRFRQM